MHHLIHRRVAKMLETSAVTLTIKCDTERNPALPAHLTLNIGTPSVGFLPDMSLKLDGDGFDCVAKIRFLGPEAREIRVSWGSVIKAEPLPRPDGGGAKVNLRLAA